ncbi:hypothetical protein ACLKA6_003713 [Drosophila palustris]
MSRQLETQPQPQEVQLATATTDATTTDATSNPFRQNQAILDSTIQQFHNRSMMDFQSAMETFAEAWVAANAGQQVSL